MTDVLWMKQEKNFSVGHGKVLNETREKFIDRDLEKKYFEWNGRKIWQIVVWENAEFEWNKRQVDGDQENKHSNEEIVACAIKVLYRIPATLFTFYADILGIKVMSTGLVGLIL